jgi:hypothetical protein
MAQIFDFEEYKRKGSLDIEDTLYLGGRKGTGMGERRPTYEQIKQLRELRFRLEMLNNDGDDKEPA